MPTKQMYTGGPLPTISNRGGDVVTTTNSYPHLGPIWGSHRPGGQNQNQGQSAPPPGVMPTTPYGEASGQIGGPFGGSAAAAPQQQNQSGANYNATITPQGVYTPEMTAHAGNQLVATQRQQADPRWLLKRFASPGRSQDAGMAMAATPFLAQSQMLGQRGLADLLVGDHLANEESMLAGEVAREQEGLGLGNLLARLQESQTSFYNQPRSQLLNLLGGMVG